MAEVVLTEVCKRYAKGGLAVDGFSLTIRDGEFLVLVGPSGCGKSTTLRMVAGLEEITSGTVAIDGRVVNNIPPKDRDIAMVFQNYALYPHMNVFDNMAFGLKLRHFPRREIDLRVREAAAALGLTDYLRRLPKQLSGGQRQRVALGRAIVRRPKVFLFDEPLSNLDAKMRVEMRAEIRRIHRQLQSTMIYVTHDQVEAMTMGDRIVVMDGGRIQQVAPPLEVYGCPANRFVAGFIGTPPMNMLEGVLSKVDGRLRFSVDPVSVTVPDSSAAALPTLPCPVVLGFRPESVRLAGDAEPAELSGTVDVVEPMGAETDLHVQLENGFRFIARLAPGPELIPGQSVRLALDPAALSLFRPEGPRL
jgi:ABC-type sugar transport systems, ATPase components